MIRIFRCSLIVLLLLPVQIAGAQSLNLSPEERRQDSAVIRAEELYRIRRLDEADRLLDAVNTKNDWVQAERWVVRSMVAQSRGQLQKRYDCLLAGKQYWQDKEKLWAPRYLHWQLMYINACLDILRADDALAYSAKVQPDQLPPDLLGYHVNNLARAFYVFGTDAYKQKRADKYRQIIAMLDRVNPARLPDDRGRASYYIIVGWCYDGLNNSRVALANLNRAAQILPGELLQLVPFYLKHNDSKQAKDELLKMNVGKLSVDEQLVWHFYMAQIEGAAGDNERVLALLNNVERLQRGPQVTFRACLIMRANALEKKGDLAKAIVSMKKAADIPLDGPAFYYGMLVDFQLKAFRYADATDSIIAAAKRGATAREVYSLGSKLLEAYAQRETLKNAEAHVRALAPVLPAAYISLLMADLFTKRSHYGDALTQLESVAAECGAKYEDEIYARTWFILEQPQVLSKKCPVKNLENQLALIGKTVPSVNVLLASYLIKRQRLREAEHVLSACDRVLPLITKARREEIYMQVIHDWGELHQPKLALKYIQSFYQNGARKDNILWAIENLMNHRHFPESLYALRSYVGRLENKEQMARYYLLVAQCKMSLGASDYLADLDRVLELTPGAFHASLWKAEYLSGNRFPANPRLQVDEAARLLSTVNQKSLTPEQLRILLLLKGKCLLASRTDRSAEAFSCLEKAAQFHVGMEAEEAMIKYLIAHHRMAEASVKLKQIDEKSLQKQELRQYLILKGICLCEGQDLVGSQSCFEAANRMREDTDSLEPLVRICARTGNLSGTRSFLEKLRKFYARNPQCFVLLGNELKALGSRDGAIAAFSQAIVLNSSCENALHDRAVCYVATNRQLAAKADLKSLERNYPGKYTMQKLCNESILVSSNFVSYLRITSEIGNEASDRELNELQQKLGQAKCKDERLQLLLAKVSKESSMNRYSLALRDIDEADRLRPNWFYTHELRAAALLALGKLPESKHERQETVRLYSEEKERNPKNTMLQYDSFRLTQ